MSRFNDLFCLFVRRDGCGDEDDFIEATQLSDFFGSSEMTQVNGIKCPTEKTYFSLFLNHGCLYHPSDVKLFAPRAELPGNEDMIIGSAFLPAPAAGRRGMQPTCP